MRRASHWIRQARADWTLHVLAVISGLVVLSERVLFHDVKELFPGGARLGQVLAALALAYLASYIFYVVVVLLPRRRIYERAGPLSQRVVSACHSIIQEIGTVAGESMTMADFPVAADRIKQLCSAAHPHGPARLVFFDGRQATLLQFIQLKLSDTATAIDSIFALMPYLDLELVRRLNSILSSPLLNQTFLGLPIRNENVDFLADWLVEYQGLCIDLAEHVSSYYPIRYVPL